MIDCEHPRSARIEYPERITCADCDTDLYYLEIGEEADYWEWQL